MKHLTRIPPFHALVGLLVVAALAAPLASSTATRTTKAAPSNTAKPTITGANPVVVGSKLVGNNGTWTGAQPITYDYQWLRCDDNAESCVKISNATGKSYTTTGSDARRTIRFRVTATNDDGNATATSDPTAQIAAEANAPQETAPPSISGDAVVGGQLTSTTGSWKGTKPITYALEWQTCDAAAANCTANGTTGSTYTVPKGDVGKRVRVKVTAKNDAGQTAGLSDATPVVKDNAESGVITLPNGEKSIAVAAIPQGQRLIVEDVKFSPSPVRSRSTPIQIKIKVGDTQNHVVRDALVFIRSTPLVASVPTDAPTGTDGWVTYNVQPEADFPLKTGYSVQFFVKAYRKGDPTLAGVSGTRLVQVATVAP